MLVFKTTFFISVKLLIYDSDNGMFLGYGLSYPKDTDNMKQSRAWDELIEELNKYVISIF